jgi:hypothetical protein
VAAVALALRGRWAEAVDVNRRLIERDGGDVRTYNRLGRALGELGRMAEARHAYAAALEIDPHDPIASRSLARLATAPGPKPGQPYAELAVDFVSEPGRSVTVSLAGVDVEITAGLRPGDCVELSQRGRSVVVRTENGLSLGVLEGRLGRRLAGLMRAGNRYAARVISGNGELRLMVREEYRSPGLQDRPSFREGSAGSIDYGRLETGVEEPPGLQEEYLEPYAEYAVEEPEQAFEDGIGLADELLEEERLEEREGVITADLLDERWQQEERDRALAAEEESDRR